ncbi:hypothetical protein LDENG_00111750 [Lucifuga dentata]|nr:hypothetical protein LDENG_00111750 [Lucifuga dentata]
MAATGTGSFLFTGDVTADGSSKMNSEVIETSYLLKFKQNLPNSLAGTSSYSKTMIPNIPLKQQRRFQS